jgi:FAD/FMN-containing dehydrogenase/Fe-S oxidoreductase
MTPLVDLQRRQLANYLGRHIQGEVRFDAPTRRLYSTDASIYQIEPLGVVVPRTEADIAVVVQTAVEAGVSITARGGGTSLSGQSIGPGIVVDCSKYLHNILDLDPAARVARVQPGVVLDQLNRAAAAHGLQFGPEVATATRANLGGMIGNNSAGARSIVYGKTIDHVRRLGVILADGSAIEAGPLSLADWQRKESLRTLEGAIYCGVRQIVPREAEEIRRRFPRILRRVSGYNLDVVCDALGARGQRSVGLVPLLIGSEGTLGVVTHAELDLIPRPKARGLLVPQFATLAAAMDAVAACLEFQPSAVEVIDHLMLDLARENLSLRDTMALVSGRPAAVLMVEFSSDQPAQVRDRVERLRKRLDGVAGITAVVAALEPEQRDPLWNLRAASMPLLYGMKGDRKPVTFVEDCAVSPARMPEFVARFRDCLLRHGTDGAFYGHASVGCLHIRPLLNLKDQHEVALMRRIMEEVTDLVLEFGGSLSGEHGDGLARSEWNRKMFGPAIYEAFRRIKQAFDPNNVLNPGKVVDAPAMTENLRYPPGYAPAGPAPEYDYERQEGLVRSIELCNGNGACRKRQGGTMCPSFRATLDEKDSTRGRANALRLALATDHSPLTTHPSPPTTHHSPLGEKWVHDVLDLCLLCKACKSECPSNVDMAKLKSEFLHHYYARRRRPLGHWLMGRIHRLNALGAPLAPLVNWLQDSRPLRWALQHVAGIDRRRSLPPLAFGHFRRWFRKHAAARPVTAGRPRVILLDDCFTTFNEPAIGKAAVGVLEAAGYSVELADIPCCGRPMISKGLLTEAKDLIRQGMPRLLDLLRDGVPLLGLEPSCLLTLADEWPDLLPCPETRRIAAACHLADGWLAKQSAAGACQISLSSREGKCVLHGHCHQKALVGSGGSAAALRLVPGLEVEVLDTGCCGMAGSFGFEKEHYDLSVAIANLSLLPALAAAPDALVAAPGTSCRHQIKDLAARRALHPLEIIAEQLV